MKYIEKLLSKNSCSEEKRTAVSIGNTGEEIAVKTIKKKGYKVIERNYRTRLGEIDIIARDKEYICFIEVRMRKRTDFGTPADTIDKRKRDKIIKAAKMYALKNNLYDMPMRFDAVLIDGDFFGGENINVEIIKDAFTTD